jgi:hypothetical protein
MLLAEASAAGRGRGLLLVGAGLLFRGAAVVHALVGRVAAEGAAALILGTGIAAFLFGVLIGRWPFARGELAEHGL